MKTKIILSVLIATAICLLGFGIYIVGGLFSQNAKLSSHAQILEKNIITLNNALRQYHSSESARSRNESEALNYLNWRFVLKDQVELARQRLTGKGSEMADLKKDKALANLTYYNLGLSCVLASDFGPAIDAFELAVKYDPKDAASYYDLGLLYSIYRKDQNKAVQYYSKYIELVPKGARSDEVRNRIDMLKNKPFGKAQGLY